MEFVQHCLSHSLANGVGLLLGFWLYDKFWSRTRANERVLRMVLEKENEMLARKCAILEGALKGLHESQQPSQPEVPPAS